MIQYFLAGIRYALWFVIIAAAMGALYGLLGGLIVEPAIASITVVGVFVMLNLVAAILCLIPALCIKCTISQVLPLQCYIGLSFGFGFVFFIFFAVIKWLPFTIIV